MGNVQISEELFSDLIRYHIYEDKNPDIESRIVSGIEEKVAALVRRREYTNRILLDNQKTHP